jgi:hypothetical protein
MKNVLFEQKKMKLLNTENKTETTARLKIAVTVLVAKIYKSNS